MAQQKGKQFERETAALAGQSSDGTKIYGRRVYRSGGIGTELGIAALSGDARWTLPWLNSEVHLECKHGYSDKGQERKSMRIERTWFDKLFRDAKQFDFLPA